MYRAPDIDEWILDVHSDDELIVDSFVKGNSTLAADIIWSVFHSQSRFWWT